MPVPKNEFFIAFLAHMPKLSLVATKNRFPAHHLDSTALLSVESIRTGGAAAPQNGLE